MNDPIDHNERCYPDMSPRRGRDDHMARYVFAAEFVKGKNVLDVGCGEGYGADMLSAAGAAHVLGIDNSAPVISAASEKYPNASFSVASATETGLPDASLDVVVSFEVWHHLDRYDEFIPEMARILKPGGTLICSVPNKHIIYLNPLHRKMLTPYYRKDFDKATILSYLAGRLFVSAWYGQRFVRPVFATIPARLLFSALSVFGGRFVDRANHIYKLANGPLVLPLSGENARILIFRATKPLSGATLSSSAGLS